MTESGTTSDSNSRAFRISRGWRSFLLAGLAYLVLIGLAYPPLVTNISSAIPGIRGREMDYSIFYWDIWWFRHAIFDLGQNPFYTNYILFPHTINLAYHTLIPFLSLVALPIYAIFGLTVAVNSLMIGALVLSALAMFAFLRHHAIPWGLAFIGGSLFVFTSFVTARVTMMHLNMLPIGWLPFALLATDWLMERRTPITAAVLSGILYMAFMTDQQFGLWLALLLPPYALIRLGQVEQQFRLRLVALAGLSLAILLGLMLIAPLPQMLEGGGKTYPRVALDGIPGFIPLEKLIAVPERLIPDEQTTLGILLPLFVMIGLIRVARKPQQLLWLLYAAIFIVLSLGPTLEPYGIPLPYRLVHLALGSLYRTPARFILLVVLSLILFVVFVLKEDYLRLSQAKRIVLIAVVLIGLAIENRWYESMPTFSVRDYRIYHAIGADREEYLVLEVPVGPSNTITKPFGVGSYLQYYAPIHHKRLINGSVSRAPAGTTHDYRQWPLITALAQERPLPDLELACREIQQLTNEWDIRYVLVHRDMLWENVANWSVGFFNTQSGWCLVDEEGPLLAYRRLDSGVCPRPDLLELPADGVLRIGDGSDARYLGLGWYSAENVGGPQARWTGEVPTSTLRVKLAAQPYRVTLRAAAYPVGQRLTVEANGQRVAEFAVSEGWNEYAFDLPADLIGPDGMTTLTLTPARAESAYERTGGQVDDQRPLSVAYDSIHFDSMIAAP
jgi:hypothetical protein